MSERKLVKVEDVMNQDYVLVDGMTTVAEALKVLRERRAHHLIVNRRHKDDEFGIVVLADIAKEVLAGNRSPDRVNVYEVMSKPVLFVRPEMNVRYCARFFGRFGISVAPVISRGKIVGIVGYDHLVLEGLYKQG